MTEKMQFDVHLPNLLREAVEGHPTPGPLVVAVNLTTPIVAALAERAIVLDDPELNVLCLRLGLYEIDARDRPAAIEAQKARGPRAQVSEHCAYNGCVHNAHGCPTWPAGSNPFSPDPDLSSLRKGAEVAVKPLEWREVNPSCDLADTPFGSIRVYRDGAWYGQWSNEGDEHSADFEAAKAAAQSDFERRIRSALVSGSREDGDG